MDTFQELKKNNKIYMRYFLIFCTFFSSIWISAQEKKVLQSFSLDSYLDTATKDSNIGSVGCFYSETLKKYKEGVYYYVDDYENISVVKFNNRFQEFDIVTQNNKNATKKGFVYARKGFYVMKVVKIPHFKNKKFDYTESIITIQNTSSKKTTSIKLFGYCGC